MGRPTKIGSLRPRQACWPVRRFRQMRQCSPRGCRRIWLATRSYKHSSCAAYPDYRVAFDAWLHTNPFVNSSAPFAPAAMPQDNNPNQQKATQLNERASATFEEGTTAGENADRYVRDTVLFAAVRFPVAVA